MTSRAVGAMGAKRVRGGWMLAAAILAVGNPAAAFDAANGASTPKVAKKSAGRTTDGKKPVARVAPEQEVYAVLLKSTVYLESTTAAGLSWWGTGWLIDAKQKLAVTNFHVVQSNAGPAVKTMAWLPAVKDGEAVHEIDYYRMNVPRIGWKIVYTDKLRDLSLVQLESLPADAAALKLADRSAKVGERLHSLAGFPRGSKGLFIYTQGTSRATYKRTMALGGEIRVLETQMPLNQGNSGGPIVNDAGELVGVFEGLMTETNVQLVNMCIDLSEVREFLKDALPLAAPTTAAVFIKRGDLHYEAARYELALTDYTAALKLDPKNAEATSSRGWTFYQRGDAETALAEFNAALKLDEQHVMARWGRATVLRDRGEYKLAAEDFTHAIRNTTDAEQLASLYNDRGVTFSNEKKYAEALADFQRAAERNPRLAMAFGNQADALVSLGRTDEALAALDKAVALDGTVPLFWNIAGNIWFERKRYDTAANMYTNALKHGNHAVYYRNRGSAYRQLSRFNEAVADLTKAVELAPKEHEYCNELALAWFGAGRYDQAVQFFSKAIALTNRHPVYFQNRGDAYQKLGKHSEAVDDLTKAIAVGDTAELRALRGRSYVALGNAEAAKADFAAAQNADSSYRLYDRAYIRVINETGEPIKVFLLYYTKTKDGKWQWFPSEPGKGAAATYTFQPGESGVLFHEGWKVNAARVRIWAFGIDSKKPWTTYRDKDWMNLSGGYLSTSDDFETFPNTFLPPLSDNRRPGR